MKDIAIFYGSNMGATEEVANILGKILDADIYNICDATKELMQKYSFLLWGSSTWGYGDLQDDWAAFLDIHGIPNLKDKTVAIFGLGDQIDHYDVFVNAIGILHDIAEEANAKIIGYWPTEGYNFGKDTTAIKNNLFKGLAIDQVIQADKTEQRLLNWSKQILKEHEDIKN